MKISLASSILILAVGAVLGWHDRQQIAAFETTRARLSAEAAKSGVSSDPARSTKRGRPAVAKLSTAEVIRLAGELERLDNAAPSYQAIRALQLRIFDNLAAWDPAGLKALLAEIGSNPELTPVTRMTLRFSCITVLANDHPQAALEMFTSSPELFKDGADGMSFVCTALATWAGNDPLAAVEWLRKNPQPFSEYAKSGIVSAVAEQDRQHAFQLITQLDFTNPNQAVWNMVKSAKTFAEKSATLAALREYLPTIQDENSRGQVAKTSIGGLAGNLGRESFDSAMRWISGENLTPLELDLFAEGLNISTSNGETGRWIEWLRQSRPGPATQQRIKEIIDQWTSSDYQAAMQWAVTRPPGNDRDQILRTIHGNWSKHDPTGKEAFAKEHGIK